MNKSQELIVISEFKSFFIVYRNFQWNMNTILRYKIFITASRKIYTKNTWKSLHKPLNSLKLPSFCLWEQKKFWFHYLLGLASVQWIKIFIYMSFSTILIDVIIWLFLFTLLSDNNTSHCSVQITSMMADKTV